LLRAPRKKEKEKIRKSLPVLPLTLPFYPPKMTHDNSASGVTAMAMMQIATDDSEHEHASADTTMTPTAPAAHSWCVCKLPLLLACNVGSCQRVKDALSDAGNDVNERGPLGTTALHLAVRAATACTVHIVQMLLTCGSNVNAVDASGFTALHVNANYAPSEEHALEVAALLLRYGARADVVIPDGLTAAQIATANNLPILAQFLSETGTVAHHHLMRQRLMSAAQALAKVRLVCDAADRGPLFGKLTRWLDLDLIQNMAPLLTEHECRKILVAIQHRRFFESLGDLASHVFGETYKSIATFDCR
jgi:hypothetical protein